MTVAVFLGADRFWSILASELYFIIRKTQEKESQLADHIGRQVNPIPFVLPEKGPRMFAVEWKTLAERNDESFAEDFSMSDRIEGPKRKVAIQTDKINPNMTHVSTHASM